MDRGIRTFAVYVLASVFAGGCTLRVAKELELAPGSERSALAPAVQMAQPPHQQVRVDLSAADELSRASGGKAIQPARPRYIQLTALEAQCEGAENSSEARLVKGERKTVLSVASRSRGSRQSARTESNFLDEAAREARNNSAANSLVLYYRLVEAESSLEIIRKSLTILDEALGDVDTLRKRGIAVPEESEQFEVQRLEMLQKQADVEATIDELNTDLRQQLNRRRSNEYTRFLPTSKLQFERRQFDIQREVQIGLKNRPELIGLRELHGDLDMQSIGTARKLLGAASGMLGGSLSSALKPILGGNRADKAELHARKRQLRDLISQREQELADDVREDILLAGTEFRAVVDFRRLQRSHEQQIEDLNQKQANVSGTFLKIAAAKLKSLQAEADAISHAVAWQLALVELRKDQGLLIVQCEELASSDHGDSSSNCPDVDPCR